MASFTLISGVGIQGQAYSLVKSIIGVDPDGATLDGSGNGDIQVRGVGGNTNYVLGSDNKLYVSGQSGSRGPVTGQQLATLREWLRNSDPFTAPK